MDTATDHTDAILGHHRTWDGTLWFRVRWASGDVTDEPLSNLVDGVAGDPSARINVHLLAYWVTHPEARPRPTWKQRTQAMSHAPASEPAPEPAADPMAVLREEQQKLADLQAEHVALQARVDDAQARVDALILAQMDAVLSDITATYGERVVQLLLTPAPPSTAVAAEAMDIDGHDEDDTGIPTAAGPFCAYQSSQGPCHAVATHGRSGPTRNNAFRAGYCDAHVCLDCKLRKMANDCNVCSACRNARLLCMGIHVGSYRRRLPEDAETSDAPAAKKRARIVY